MSVGAEHNRWEPRGTVAQDAPNRRLQLTAFGARDRAFFEGVLWSAPRRQLKRSTFGGSHQCSQPCYTGVCLFAGLLSVSSTVRLGRSAMPRPSISQNTNTCTCPNTVPMVLRDSKIIKHPGALMV